MTSRSTLRLGLMFLAVTAGLQGAVRADAGDSVIEAEANAASDSRVATDPKASAGKAVVNGRAWQPLVGIDVPSPEGAGAAGPLYVWFRHRGGPVQLKVISDAGQTEKDWVWDQPQEWAWSRVGPYARADLGRHIVLMRGDGPGEVGIDAVRFTTDQQFVPRGRIAAGPKVIPPDRPDAKASPVTVEVKVDWSTRAGAVPARIWGVNDYEVEQVNTAQDPAFNAFMRKLAPPVIRVHRGGLPAGWMKPDGRTFDIERMKAAFDGVEQGYGQSELMINIASWPEWMTEPDRPGVLANKHEDAFAEYCVELMRVMRDEVGRKVDYWEVLNERDGAYEAAGRLDDLWRQYNKAARAMKRFDPQAKIGGPAFTWAKGSWVDGFVRHCLKEGTVDFVTYHNYGIGDVHDPNEQLFERIDAFAGHARDVRRAVDAATAGTGRHVPVFLTEYNVKWTWDPIERRHGNAVGAVFQAGVVRRLALAGIDGAMVWHVKGHAYGILGGDNVPRLTLPLYFWGPRHLVGDAVATDAPLATLEVLAVQRPDGGRAVLIANKADHPVVVPRLSDLLGGKGHLARLDADGVRHLEAAGKSAHELPGYSLTLLSTDPIDTSVLQPAR